MSAQAYSCADAGRSVGVSGALIGRWKCELEAHEAEALPGRGRGTVEPQRIPDNESEKRRLQLERDL